MIILWESFNNYILTQPTIKKDDLDEAILFYEYII